MRLYPLCYLLLTLLLVAAPAAAAGDPAVTAAREYVASGDMNGAIGSLQTYLKTHPEDLTARRFLGDLYFRVGQIDRAALVYESVIHEAPYDKETHNRLGTVYAEENRVDDAIREFEAALPGTDSVGDLVQLHERKGDLPRYMAKVLALARAFPNDADIQAELGQLYDATHQPQQAVEVFEHALTIQGDDLTALNGLGLAYLDMHQYEDAILTFQRCLRVDINYQCVNNMGAAYLEAHQLAQAKATLDRAFRLEPERGETFVNYGYLADAQNNWQAAAAEYGKAIERYPYLREAYIDLALDYEKHGLYVLAQAVLLKGIASVYDDGRLHVLLGQAYQAQGNRMDALTQYRLGLRGSDPAAISIASHEIDALSPTATHPPQ
jgi:tetratricopeptide (TPR) repeat protein